jgi:hypothetical protein
MIPLVPKHLRKIKFWVRYRPKSREVIQMRKLKQELAQPSKASGDVIFQVTGFYINRRSASGST